MGGRPWHSADAACGPVTWTMSPHSFCGQDHGESCRERASQGDGASGQERPVAQAAPASLPRPPSRPEGRGHERRGLGFL